MAARTLIVIGASAGGVEAVATLIARLPADLPAAVCVVVHQPAYQASRLTEVFDRAGAIRVVTATDGAPLEHGTVYVAPRDRHLLVDDGHLRLVRGPKENRVRPAVDPLFRSAALAHGPGVIGVVLTGALDDGTAGLWSIRDRGGLAVVQDPADAQVTGMPASALSEVGADYVAPVADLGPLLARLAGTRVDLAAHVAPDPAAMDDLAREVAIGALDETAHEDVERPGVPSRFSCPDCGGVLWDTRGGRGPLRYRCETGHAHAAASLAESQVEAVEEALWAALRALEDQAALAHDRAVHAGSRGQPATARQLEAGAEAARQHAVALRGIIRQNDRSGRDVRLDAAPDPARQAPAS